MEERSQRPWVLLLMLITSGWRGRGTSGFIFCCCCSGTAAVRAPQQHGQQQQQQQVQTSLQQQQPHVCATQAAAIRQKHVCSGNRGDSAAFLVELCQVSCFVCAVQHNTSLTSPQDPEAHIAGYPGVTLKMVPRQVGCMSLHCLGCNDMHFCISYWLPI